MKPARKSNVVREEWPKIVKIVLNGNLRWQVDARPSGRREICKSEIEAIRRANALAKTKLEQGTAAVTMPPQLRAMAIECHEKLAVWGKTLRDATAYYIASMEDARLREESHLMQFCLKEWLTVREEEHKRKDISDATLRETKSMRKIFANAFGNINVRAVNRQHVETFLGSVEKGPRTRNNYRVKLGTFFNFARNKGWIDHNPAAGIKVRIPDEEVVVLSVEEAHSLIKAASDFPLALPYLVISLFAGLRPYEAQALDWSNVFLKTRQIRVLAATSKTRETRYVPINDTLLAWLTPLAKGKSGPVIGPVPGYFRNAWEGLRASLGYCIDGKNVEERSEQGEIIKEQGPEWPPDCLRHTFASYWLPIHHSRSELAEIMGNSESVIRKHYRRAVPANVAQSYWKILPKKRR